MIYNQDLFHLDDTMNELLHSILSSKEFSDYEQLKQAIAFSPEVTHLVSDFQEKKELFEQIESYGKHAPDYKETSRNLRKAKRALDVHPLISDFRFSENQFQGILDEVCLSIASTISEEIKVDAGNPFFSKHSGCGGSCHAS